MLILGVYEIYAFGSLLSMMLKFTNTAAGPVSTRNRLRDLRSNFGY
jgi:hypothetical protein